MFDEGAVLQFVVRERGFPVAELREEFVGFAVVVQVDEECEFDRRGVFDGVVLPRLSGGAGVLIPRDAAGKPGDGDDVDAAVTIDVERKIAERVDVVVGEVQVAEPVTSPLRRLVPVLA
jgi:hypothetical protein